MARTNQLSGDNISYIKKRTERVVSCCFVCLFD